MTMTTAEEGNRFYFCPQTGTKQNSNSLESSVSRSVNSTQFMGKLFLSTEVITFGPCGVDLKTLNIVICIEKYGQVMRPSWIQVSEIIFSVIYYSLPSVELIEVTLSPLCRIIWPKLQNEIKARGLQMSE